MTSVVPTSANEFIERQLDERLEAMGKSFNSDALSLGFVKK